MAALQLNWWTVLLGLVCGAVATQFMPRFNFKQSNKVLLTWGDTWEVGTSNMIAMLTKEKIINIKISIGGDYGGGLKRILEYQCPSDPAPVMIDLTSVSSTSTECPLDIPFTIRPTGGSANEDFELKLGASKAHFTDTFSKKLKLSVRVEFSTGELRSNPLFVWNLQPLSSFSSDGAEKRRNRRFLTEEAITLMTKLGYSQDVAFPTISFLEPAITSVIRDAPPFFRSKLNLGSILNFDAGQCVSYQLGKAILFTSYYSKFDERHHHLMKLQHLDVQSGRLSFSACGLKQQVKEFFDEKRPQSTVGICAMVSFTGEVEPYLKVVPVTERFNVANLSYTGCPTASKNCEVAPNETTRVIIVAGMDYTAIVCPIICNDKSEVYRFYRDGKQLIGSPTSEWSLLDGVRVSKSGNIIEFPPTVTAAHSGIYRCEAGSKQFSFQVTVLSLPHFAIAAAHSVLPDAFGQLPETLFAMEGESFSFNCTVRFASLSSVSVAPAFHIADTSAGRLSWVSLNDEGFRQKVGATAESLTLTRTAAEASQTLTVTVSRVPPANPSLMTNFSHRFECNASVDSAESQLVGMRNYQAQSYADVLYIPRLTREKFAINPNNNCSIQRCSVKAGARFEFAMSANTIAYLSGAGVVIDAYFRLDNLLLDDVQILFANHASKQSFSSLTSRLVYQVEPIASHGVLAELQKRRNLTAVFNLRYRRGTPVTNLWHNKTAHGRAGPALDRLDCRADPLCFYSTDFDLDRGLLDVLSVGLDFEVARLPTAEASVSLLVGIGVAVAAALALGLVVVYLLTRSPERAYQLEATEIKMGRDPRADAKAEAFKEYVHACADTKDVRPSVLGVMQSMASTASVNSSDDLELTGSTYDVILD